MNLIYKSNQEAVLTLADGFDVLDVCHRQTVIALGKLAALVSQLSSKGADEETRALASEIVQHFSTTARQHHEDEERHVFPKLTSSGDAESAQAVLRLQQDHGWLEQDWLELWPHLDAVACGHFAYDLDVLRDGAEIFVALMHDHMALEESLIYPQARMRSGTEERLGMGREMAGRRRVQREAKAIAAAAHQPD